MKIVIGSGKGGTGKTTLAVNLATALAASTPATAGSVTTSAAPGSSPEPVAPGPAAEGLVDAAPADAAPSGEGLPGAGLVGLLDCDVEEPNCHLYLKPSFGVTEPVGTTIPVIDEEACTSCGLCARACEFHALVALPGVPLLLPELCHSCGVCEYVCPEGAITEVSREIGALGAGMVNGIYLRWGELCVGEARSTPLIQAVKNLAKTPSGASPAAPPLDTVIIDAPPGVACPAVEAMRGADFAVLVTEPTPFGLHDLELAVETARQLSLPFGVVINRAGIGDDRVVDFCVREDIPILMQIPDNRRIAEACSRGEAYAAGNADFASDLRRLAGDIWALIAAGVALEEIASERVTAL